MQTKSRNGKFIVSASNGSKVANSNRIGEADAKEYDEINTVSLYVVDGQKVTIYDVASTIHEDCFDTDGGGLRLLYKTLRCNVIFVKKTYHFVVEKANCINDVLQSIAEQFEL